MFYTWHKNESPSSWVSLISATILLLCVSASKGCSKPQSGERPIVLQPLPLEPLQCVETPPPSPSEIILIGPEGGCPAQFAACIGVATGQKSARYLTEIRVWSDSAWVACKKASEDVE